MVKEIVSDRQNLTISRINSWIMVSTKRRAIPATVATAILGLNDKFAEAGVGLQRTIVRADVVNNDDNDNSFHIMVPVIVAADTKDLAEGHYAAVLEAIKGVEGVHKIDPYRVELEADHNPTDPDTGNKPPGASTEGDNTWG